MKNSSFFHPLVLLLKFNKRPINYQIYVLIGYLQVAHNFTLVKRKGLGDSCIVNMRAESIKPSF